MRGAEARKCRWKRSLASRPGLRGRSGEMGALWLRAPASGVRRGPWPHGQGYGAHIDRCGAALARGPAPHGAGYNETSAAAADRFDRGCACESTGIDSRRSGARENIDPVTQITWSGAGPQRAASGGLHRKPVSFTIRHPTFIILHSPFVIQHSSFVISPPLSPQPFHRTCQFRGEARQVCDAGFDFAAHDLSA